jgi:hypothetical protein
MLATAFCRLLAVFPVILLSLWLLFAEPMDLHALQLVAADSESFDSVRFGDMSAT